MSLRERIERGKNNGRKENGYQPVLWCFKNGIEKKEREIKMEIIEKNTRRKTRFELIDKGKAFVYNNRVAMKIEPFEDSFDGDGINAIFLDNGDAIWLDYEDIVYVLENCSFVYA